MKGQNSPEVANQGWPCVILWSPKLFTCKEFLKKWPHWGSCECTGWRTPNTVLYMEEKPRGENRFWWISTSWPISDRKSRGFCSPVSRKEGVGDSKHLLQGRGGWRFLLLLVISEQENWGFLCSSDVQRAPRNQQQAGLYLDDRSPCIPASDCTAQSIHQSQRDVGWQYMTVLLVSVWHQDGRNVILSRRFSVVWDQACQRAVKWTFLRQYIHLFWPKRCPDV